MRIETDKIYCGDSLQVLQTLPDNCLDCCVTSPPYYALRDYGTDGQIGREATPEEYVSRITAVFHEVKRVLTPEGTCWLNIADTYCGTGSKADHQDPKYPKGRNGQQVAVNHRAPGCKPKDLIGIPWLVALALRGDGWYLRSSIIWHKGNAMPESTRDRPTRCYEYVFLLTKSKKILLRLASSSRADSPHNGGTAEKRSWERQQICRYRSGAKPAAENQPSPQERRIHRRNDFPRPQPPQRLADQHSFLSRRAFCSVPAQTCGNVHFVGLSCRRDCA